MSRAVAVVADGAEHGGRGPPREPVRCWIRLRMLARMELDERPSSRRRILAEATIGRAPGRVLADEEAGAADACAAAGVFVIVYDVLSVPPGACSD